ncbi:MAG TPA: 2'-5' RNA ligase family protein [Trebonia sp.]
MRNHWWWRPGMRPGRRVDTFYVTLGGLPAARELAASARQRLGGLPGLDLVPDEWLHLTMQEIGFSDEVTGTDVAAIIAAASDGLAALAPATVTIGQPTVVGEGIICLVTPAGALGPARNAVRAAISDVRGPDRVPDSAEWTRWSPHMSLGYANADGPAEPFETALDGCTDVATVTVGAVDLIRFGRDRQMYEWETIARLPLGGSATAD